MTFKKVARYTISLALALVIFVVLYLGAAYSLARIATDAAEDNLPQVAIFIKTNGVHTDIVVPTRDSIIDWSKEVKLSNTLANDSAAKYLAMGWGDKGFYLETPNWSDLKARVAFNAAFGLGSTAIHATFYRQMREGESCRKIMISRSQYSDLVNYISSSFKRETGHFINIQTSANYGRNDAFYEANGSYSMFHTCNTWANNALKSCGQRACWWTPFDTGIFILYK